MNHATSFEFHAVQHKRMVKDYCEWKKHQSKKETHLAATTSAPRQTTMKTMIASKDHRDEFVVDFVRMRTE